MNIAVKVPKSHDARTIGLPLGPILACIAFALASTYDLGWQASWTAGVTTLCAVWWVLEPIPIQATSLLPFVLLPVGGVLDRSAVATAYGHRLILLLLGGFILSTAMERSGAHRRLALGMVRLVGGAGGKHLVLGFMLAAAVLSMWISNTATTLMLIPVALAVLETVDEDEQRRLATPLLLGVAYAASIGGIGTPIGTPPNVIFMAHYENLVGHEWGFLAWMKIGVPVVICFVPLVWLWLTRKIEESSRPRLEDLGPWQTKERRVLAVFAVTAVLWTTRSEPFGGWSDWLSLPGVGDSTVALAMAVVMFLVPDGDGGRLLDWPTANRIPWGLMILFGGGMALGKAFGSSGLSAALGSALSGLTEMHPIVQIATICLFVTFLTEVTSNTATSNILMPILGAVGISAGADPSSLMIPAALSASCAFMLPVATAPNAIVFGYEKFPTRVMSREGFVPNLIGVVVITLIVTLFVQ